MVHHNVYFWLKDPASPAAQEKLIAGLESLRAIEVARSLTIGRPAPTADRDVVDTSFDISEHMTFDSIEDEQIYQDHPIHRDFIEHCGHLWREVLVYDSLKV